MKLILVVFEFSFDFLSIFIILLIVKYIDIVVNLFMYLFT